MLVSVGLDCVLGVPSLYRISFENRHHSDMAGAYLARDLRHAHVSSAPEVRLIFFENLVQLAQLGIE
jgi:hypothetical protein